MNPETQRELDPTPERLPKKALFSGVEAPASLRDAPGMIIKRCALCAARDADRVYMQAHFPVVRCRGCGLVYADEHFRAEDLERFYSGDYYERAYVCHPPAIDEKIARDYERLFRPVDRRLGGGRLLDLGCARGTFLRALEARGYGSRWRLGGVDMNPDEVRMGIAAGLDLKCGTLEELDIRSGSCDAVTAFSVLEHLQDPMAVFSRIADIVKPGGQLVAVVPSGRCLIVGAALLAHRILGARARRFADTVFHEEHLYYFTAETLGRALAQVGFELERVRYLPSYLETHPPGPLVALGAWSLRAASFVLRRQTMLGVVARRTTR